MFNRYIGIDYSGAETPTSSLKGLRVYLADDDSPPREVFPPPGLKRYWTRKGIAEWLSAELVKGDPVLVGIDHCFSFPVKYFQEYNIPLDWGLFLDDFHHHWPTDGENMCVEFIRDGRYGIGSARQGKSTWFRLTDRWTASAKSMFLFDVQGSVAKSTFAGLPWLRFLRQQKIPRLHFWPFDGWDIPAGHSVIAEVYPSLWTRRFPIEKRDNDQHAAYAVAAWMRRADANGSLQKYFKPPLDKDELSLVVIEGWILGID